MWKYKKIVLHICQCSTSLHFPSDPKGQKKADIQCQGRDEWGGSCIKREEEDKRMARKREKRKTWDLHKWRLWIRIYRHTRDILIQVHTPTNSNKDSKNWMWAMRGARPRHCRRLICRPWDKRGIQARWVQTVSVCRLSMRDELLHKSFEWNNRRYAELHIQRFSCSLDLTILDGCHAVNVKCIKISMKNSTSFFHDWDHNTSVRSGSFNVPHILTACSKTGDLKRSEHF